MNRQHTFVSALSLTLLWLLALPVHAATEAGRILFARGTVSIVGENESARGAGVGDVFHEGERIVTGNRSIVQLRLSDGALTALRSNSDYQIERQRFDEEADVYEQAGRLITGWMRSVTGTIGARYPGNVSQGTSVATIGIRGTTYQIIHVPEQGLPEFPNLQPGSYIYLEDGQIEVSNEAGSRVVSPGQVVRIRGPNVSPELTPELTELFQSQLLASLGGGDTDGFEVRNLLDNATDQIVDGAAGGAAPPFTGPVFAMSSCASQCFPVLEPVSVEGGFAGEGRGRYLQQVLLGGGDVVLTGEEGRSPTGVGYYAFYSGGELASQVHWGRWLESDYLVNGMPADSMSAGDWRYIMGENLFDSEIVVQAAGLTGVYRYDYVAGSSFQGKDSLDMTPAGSINMTRQSYLELDFGDLSLFADVRFSNGDRLTGSGALSNLFFSGLSLDGVSANESPLSGFIAGAVAGSGAEGIAAIIGYENFSNYIRYEGTAIFERGAQLPPPPYGGVSAFSTFSESKGVIDPRFLEVGTLGEDIFPTYAQVDTGASYELIGNSTQPSSPVSSRLVLDANDNVVATVYWGLWDASSYLVNEISEGTFSQTPTSDWHFMITDKPLTETMVANIGLTGTYVYDYIDGTPLKETTGVLPDLAIGTGSTVTVDFSNLMATTAIDVNLEIGGLNMAGTGNVADLYSGFGIGLADSLDPIASASISGTFAGSNAEALLGAVSYNYNTEAYIGTALFERPPEVGVGN